MRRAFLSLALVGITLLALTVLLPIIGALFLFALILFALIVGLMVAAPFLAKLPWFRDRIFVHRQGPGRTIRFGRDGFGFDPSGGEPANRPGESGDVIDVHGRDLDGDKRE